MTNEELKQLIAENRIEECFEALLGISRNTPHENDVLLLMSQYQGWKREKRLGLSSDRLVPNQIREALLELLPELTRKRQTERTKGKRRTMVIAAIAATLFLSLCIGYALYDPPQSGEAQLSQVKDEAQQSSGVSEPNKEVVSSTENFKNNPASSPRVPGAKPVAAPPSKPTLSFILFRDGASPIPIGTGDTIRLGDKLSIAVEYAAGYCIYVLLNDSQGGLSPLNLNKSGSPKQLTRFLSEPGRYLLPEGSNGWKIDKHSGLEYFIVLLSKQPINSEELNNLVTDLKRISPRGIEKTEKRLLTQDDLITPASEVLARYIKLLDLEFQNFVFVHV